MGIGDIKAKVSFIICHLVTILYYSLYMSHIIWLTLHSAAESQPVKKMKIFLFASGRNCSDLNVANLQMSATENKCWKPSSLFSMSNIQFLEHVIRNIEKFRKFKVGVGNFSLQLENFDLSSKKWIGTILQLHFRLINMRLANYSTVQFMFEIAGKDSLILYES